MKIHNNKSKPRVGSAFVPTSDTEDEGYIVADLDMNDELLNRGIEDAGELTVPFNSYVKL